MRSVKHYVHMVGSEVVNYMLRMLIKLNRYIVYIFHSIEVSSKFVQTFHRICVFLQINTFHLIIALSNIK